MTRSRQATFVWLLILLGILAALIGTGLFIAAFPYPARRGTAIGVHLLGWVMLLAGLFGLSRLPRRLPTAPLPNVPTAERGASAGALAIARQAHFRPALRIARLCLLLGLLIWTASGLWDGMAEIGETWMLWKQGRRTTAQVIGKDSVRDPAAGGPVHFAFRIDGRAIVGHYDASPEEHANAWIGMTLPVTYLPSDPRIHRRGVANGQAVLASCRKWGGFLLKGLLLLGAPFLAIERRFQPQLYLARAGLAVTGTVITRLPLGRRRQPAAYRLAYRFPMPNGQTQTGCARVKREAAERLLPGDPLAILYEPGHPERSLPEAALSAVQIRPAEKPTFRTVRYDNQG
jgi:hypothetical protein